MNNCPHCHASIEGRSDKKFCSIHCKSAYQYQIRKTKEVLYYKIDRQLKLNRKLLKKYNQAGLATIRKEKLTTQGFNPKYFTHYWKNGKGQLYLFCYEYGYLGKSENGKDKYVLVQWQDYMGR